MPITAAAANAALADIWPASEYEIIELSPRHARTHRQLNDVQLRPGGFVPGPTQFAIADAALWYLVFGALNRNEQKAMTSELSNRFLRPCVGQKLYA